jgi:hypothetical protein
LSGRRSFFLGVAVSCTVWAALGYSHLRSLGLDVRLQPVEDLNSGLNSGRVRTRAVGTPEAQAAFLELLKESGFSAQSAGTVESVVRLQVWVGNSVRKVAAYDGPARGYELLQYGLRGGGLLCGGMSDILREALVLLSVPARTVQLFESGFRGRSTHVVVETLVEGQWRVFDPTFNVTYEGDGQALGVSQIQERLRRLGPDSVKAVFHGKRAYPADLERDDPGWRQLFSDAYVSDLGRSPSPWLGMPPWRYWTGPTIYYFGDNLMLFPAGQDRRYFFVTVVAPAAALLSALIALFPVGRGRKDRRRRGTSGYHG